MESYKDITVNKVLGMDVEPEDRDVGIFGNTYTLVFDTAKDKEWDGSKIQLLFFDDQMEELLEVLEPYFDKYKQEKEWSKE